MFLVSCGKMLGLISAWERLYCCCHALLLFMGHVYTVASSLVFVLSSNKAYISAFYDWACMCVFVYVHVRVCVCVCVCVRERR